MLKIVASVLFVVFLTSCSSFSGFDGRRGVSSSLVDFLYPDGQVPPQYEETKPHLQLPITVGLAFVPPNYPSSSGLPEAKKTELLEQVRTKFIGLDYVKEISIVPETYMRSSKGFDGIGQLARLYGLDVVALVSYDQVAVSSERNSALLYWTIVGAYVIRGNQNQTTTFVDTAVFDVRSQKMLFRAPGVSDIKQSSTLVEVGSVNRELREKGFEAAMADMTENLAIELDRFKERISTDGSVEVSHREGYGGSGAMPWPLVLLLIGLTLVRFRHSLASKIKEHR